MFCRFINVYNTEQYFVSTSLFIEKNVDKCFGFLLNMYFDRTLEQGIQIILLYCEVYSGM